MCAFGLLVVVSLKKVAFASLEAAAPYPVYVHDGAFLDTAGRERHFRGVNVVYKDPPWLPWAEEFHPNVSFVQDDVDFLVSLGVNLIRLGVMWPGVVPRKRGKVDKKYLERARALTRMAASAGIYTIMEPHQDEVSPRFCGEGVPDWWAEEFLEVKSFPEPLARSYGTKAPTREQCLSQVSFDYLWTHDLAKAFQGIWDHGAADFGAYWAEVATYFADDPAVIGGELWNEPFPGDVYVNGGRLRDNRVADEECLLPFYTNVSRALRRAVPERDRFAIAYEPTWPVGTQDIDPGSVLTPRSGFPAFPEENAIYAFHYYVPPCSANLTSYLEARLADAKRLRAVPFASEFNLAVQDSRSEEQMTAAFQAFESRLVSYAGWQYKSFSGSLPAGTCTGCGNSFFWKNGSLNEGMARAMARPFASAVAGHTLSSEYEPGTRAYTLEYLRGEGVGAPTEVVFPGHVLRAAEGLRVEVRGDREASVEQRTRPGSQIAGGPQIRSLHVVHVAHPGASVAGQRVRVRVSPVASSETPVVAFV